MRGFGANFKHALSRPGPWNMRFYGFGECLPNRDNFIAIDKGKVDAWGIPTIKINCMWRENERALLKDMSITAAGECHCRGREGHRTLCRGQRSRAHDS